MLCILFHCLLFPTNLLFIPAQGLWPCRGNEQPLPAVDCVGVQSVAAHDPNCRRSIRGSHRGEGLPRPHSMVDPPAVHRALLHRIRLRSAACLHTSRHPQQQDAHKERPCHCPLAQRTPARLLHRLPSQLFHRCISLLRNLCCLLFVRSEEKSNCNISTWSGGEMATLSLSTSPMPAALFAPAPDRHFCIQC